MGAAPASARAARHERSTILRRARPAMGTFVALTLRGTRPGVLEGIARAVFEEIERLEGILSEWRESSALSEVNGAAGIRAVAVPPELIEVAEIAREAWAATSGAFDSTWRPLADAWRDRPRPPSPRSIAAKRALVGFESVDVDRRACTVFLRRRGMKLGFGGVAKAFIAERAAELATRSGVRDVLVDAGGDVIARGRNGALPWRIAIRHPREPGAIMAIVSLRDEAVATSGDYESFLGVDGHRYNHILDPRTGRPATACRSVTVVAPRGGVADALATGFFVLGEKHGARIAAALPGVEALFVTGEGTLHVSRNGSVARR